MSDAPLPGELTQRLGKPFAGIALGTAPYDQKGKREWFAVLDRYLELGGRVLDTGRHYGESESVVGDWMAFRGAREQVIIITKGAHGDGKIPADAFEELVEQELLLSLQHLRTDRVDVYMLHRDNPTIPVSRIIRCLNAHLDSGRVRTIGVSNWAYDRVAEANEYADRNGLAGFALVSNNLSLAIPAEAFYPGLVTADREGECWHEETGVPLLPWSSLARGFFSGRFTPEMRTRSSELDEFTQRMLVVYGTDANFERLRRAATLGERSGGYSASQVALAWLLHRPFPVVPLVGPRTPQEVESCFCAMEIRLTPGECAWLNLEC